MNDELNDAGCISQAAKEKHKNPDWGSCDPDLDLDRQTGKRHTLTDR